MVYELTPGQLVLKVAKNTAGMGQNKEEATVCTADPQMSYFAKVSEVGPENMWIVQEQAEHMDPGKFQSLTGIPWKKFNSGLFGLFGTPGAIQPKHQQDAKELGANPFFDEIVKIIKSCGYVPDDLTKLDSWGIVKGKPVIIDYGFTQSVRAQHYTQGPGGSVVSESVIDEAEYPKDFSLDELKKLPSFAARIRYVKAHLPKVGQGSSRIVFGVDPYTVLKLALNAKGNAQNYAEISASSVGYEVIAEVKDFAEDSQWLEMERATRINTGKFKALTGVTFKEFAQALQYWYTMEVKSSRNYAPRPAARQDEIENKSWFIDLQALIVDTDTVIGDIQRISSWGSVVRDGKEVPVLIDYGATAVVMRQHYGTRG